MKPTVKFVIALVSIYASIWHFAPRSIYAKSFGPPPAWLLNSFVQQQKLTFAGANGNEHFGRVVALSGDTAVVGAPAEDTNETGSAFVFVRSGGVWTQQQELRASDGAPNDSFGHSVAIDGDTALIGSVGDDNSRGTNAGSAYFFTRSGGVWTLQQRVQATDGAVNDGFGYSVSLSGDNAVISAVGDDNGGAQSGSAYIFSRSAGIWSQQQRIQAADAKANANFGHSTSIDSNNVLIGAWQDNAGPTAAGAAYVFIKSGETWTQQQKLTAPDAGPLDFFGTAVSLSGDTAIVGASLNDNIAMDAGAAYVFTRSSGVWTHQQKLLNSNAGAGDNFGSSVSVSGDTAIVGAYLDNLTNANFGAAFVFTRSGSVWTRQQKLIASDAAAGDAFGLSLAFNGSTLIIGAPDDGVNNDGSAYVFVPELPNSPPVVDAGPDQSTTEEVSFNLVASFTDPDINDTHTATINWGDGSPTQAASVTEPSGSSPGVLNASHAYLAPGTYQVTVTVTDAASATASDTLQVTVAESVSDNYIHNTTTPQPNANFNISGNGVIAGNLSVNGTLNANGSALTDLNASNITTGTIDNARLGLIPSANIADGAVVKTLNGLTDNVTLAAGNNVTITPSGNTLTVSAAAGSSQWTTSGSNIFYNAGNVGIGTTTPTSILDVVQNQNANTFIRLANTHTGLTGKAFFLADNGTNVVRLQQNGTGFGGFGATLAGEGVLYSTSPGLTLMSDNANGILKFSTGGPGERMRIDANGNVGIGLISPTAKLHVGGDGRVNGSFTIGGNVVLSTLGTSGGTVLCRNAFNQIAFCSSSLRYKTNIAPFSFGLSLVKLLRPIRFDWKGDGLHDIGFGAEDVALIEPLLVTYNAMGAVEGVKYDRISAVLVNAVKEQQVQIEAQQVQLKHQQNLIDSLRMLVCKQYPDANICR